MSCVCVSLVSHDARVRFARFGAVCIWTQKKNSLGPSLLDVGSGAIRHLHIMLHTRRNSKIITNARKDCFHFSTPLGAGASDDIRCIAQLRLWLMPALRPRLLYCRCRCLCPFQPLCCVFQNIEYCLIREYTRLIISPSPASGRPIHAL